MKKNSRDSLRKSVLVFSFFLLSFLHVILIFNIRVFDCPSDWLCLTSSCYWAFLGMIEPGLWVVGLLLMFLDLKQDGKFGDYLKTCYSFWPVFLFVFLALLSVGWSVLKGITVFQVFILAATTLAGVYIGFTYRLHRIMDYLGWFFGFVIVFSLFNVFAPSNPGVMTEPYYKGGWRGIFWHRNYLGCFMSISLALALIRLLTLKKQLSIQFFGNLLLFLFSGILVYKSKSATGLLSAIILLGLVFLIFIWIRVRKYLKPTHYLAIVIFFILGSVLVLTNLDFIFALLDRNVSLTGRLPMWQYVFEHLVSKRPLLGYGYGAIWHFSGVRNGLAETLNWSTPVLIGDNGFVDIFLHLGLAGVIILVGLVIGACYFSFRYLLQEPGLLSAFPLTFMAFFLVTNITLSMILESESFVWMIALANIVCIKTKSLKNCSLH